MTVAQNIKIELLCDACKQDGIHNDEAETLPAISLNHKAPLFLDLCEPHRKELYDPLADLLARDGRSEDGKRRRRKKATPKAAEPAPEPIAPEPTLVDLGANVCPECNQTFNTEQGMKAHYTRKHAEQVAKREKAQAKAKTNTGEFVCPDCGKDDFARPSAQAVSMHRVRAHGYRKGDDEAAA